LCTVNKVIPTGSVFDLYSALVWYRAEAKLMNASLLCRDFVSISSFQKLTKN
jgi:hypothetical protein